MTFKHEFEARSITVVRRADGSVDVQHYEAKALKARREALAGTVRSVWRALSRLIRHMSAPTRGSAGGRAFREA